MHTEQAPLANKEHLILMAKLEIQTAAIREMLGDAFSDEAMEKWVLENDELLHEIVERPDIKNELEQLVEDEARKGKQDDLRTELANRITRELREGRFPVAA